MFNDEKKILQKVVLIMLILFFTIIWEILNQIILWNFIIIEEKD